MTARRVERLFVYGSLLPGESNARQLAGLAGTWIPAGVRGRLAPEGWGSGLGYPGLILDPAGAPVTGRLFRSAGLEEAWTRLDAFEGDDYARVRCTAETEAGPVEAWVYVVRR